MEEQFSTSTVAISEIVDDIWFHSSTRPPPATEDPGKGGLIVNETITNLNVTNTEYIPIAAAAVTFSVLIIVGVFCILIFVIILIRGRKKFQEFPFFAIVHHLTAANAIHIFFQATTVLPIMIIETSDDSSGRVWYKIGSYSIMATEQAALYFTFLMAINRLAVFVLPSVLKYFTIKRIHIISSFLWIYVFFIVWWNVNYGTIRRFRRRSLSATEVLLGSNILTQFFTLCSSLLPILMLFMYGLIFTYITKKRQINSHHQYGSQRDKLLLYQAAVIAVALEVVNITDMVTPFFKKTSTTVQWIWTIFCYCATIFNQLVNPLLFLTYNKFVRNIAKHLFSKNFASFLSDASSVPKNIENRASNTRSNLQPGAVITF
ncbi:unnamed protein product [Caenorhabditis bovis]|uniref:G-protein coupled receptors family 1 profile domain-containing protein n=1 Tax=Caenorhabditis bovis TaxID=2654633 RepID=A0A8S1EXE2_9PELO|nr:unnamed protein product [Caenorhabditis bovis]